MRRETPKGDTCTTCPRVHGKGVQDSGCCYVVVETRKISGVESVLRGIVVSPSLRDRNREFRTE